jgi:ribonuclease BN (tRNA processing enzyme)
MTVTVTFAGSGDAFGSGGRFQACIHLRHPALASPVLLDCGATSLPALRRSNLDPQEVGTVFVSHLHGDHFGGLPFLILDGQFSRRTRVLRVVGPPGTAQRLATAMECLFPGSAYTGDTAWVPAIASAAAGADLLIAEAYYWDKAVPHHLRYADLAAHESEIRARRTICTHMSADMLAHQDDTCAYDGLVVRV